MGNQGLYTATRIACHLRGKVKSYATRNHHDSPVASWLGFSEREIFGPRSWWCGTLPYVYIYTYIYIYYILWGMGHKTLCLRIVPSLVGASVRGSPVGLRSWEARQESIGFEKPHQFVMSAIMQTWCTPPRQQEIAIALLHSRPATQCFKPSCALRRWDFQSLTHHVFLFYICWFVFVLQALVGRFVLPLVLVLFTRKHSPRFVGNIII